MRHSERPGARVFWQPMHSHIHVTCAIIRRRGCILAARRSASMSMPLKWEFPGGKIHEGETPEDCLRRELLEELRIGVKIGRPLPPSTHQYPGFLITLYPFLCKIVSGDLIPVEHDRVEWLKAEELSRLDWADADRPILCAVLALPTEKDE